ncbi:hypothetical protein LOAG_11053 [Loa loa]|uniref:Uncharacterized protein n=1 Tax=Loa loa TaxID=7209 RepID=A0A1S0TNQ9_LOALO|nr:hypothetical protein LOAG_11053 [Loa loa]EFO17449.1 hypothetical protein LOAG_11053 [Loa loa]
MWTARNLYITHAACIGGIVELFQKSLGHLFKIFLNRFFNYPLRLLICFTKHLHFGAFNSVTFFSLKVAFHKIILKLFSKIIWKKEGIEKVIVLDSVKEMSTDIFILSSSFQNDKSQVKTNIPPPYNYSGSTVKEADPRSLMLKHGP